MSDKHFIIFMRSDPHSVVWFARQKTVEEAFVAYALDAFAHFTAEGLLAGQDEEGNEYTFSHPVQAIEMQVKGGAEWQIREVNDHDWNANFAEIFCSEDAYSIEEYIEICLEAFSKELALDKNKAFVWYLKNGPLVCFYEDLKDGSLRISVTHRFHIARETYPRVEPWHGNYDDLLNQLLITFPEPNRSL
jgi:hypothetical protein